jgi:hypothetical protein
MRRNEGDGVDRMETETNDSLEEAESLLKYRPYTASCVARFWSKVAKTPTCWLWLDTLNTSGYGRFTIGRGNEKMAHRLAFELEVGPIPEGLTLDHLCNHTDCVRPSHLEPVTARENQLRRWARQRARDRGLTATGSATGTRTP